MVPQEGSVEMHHTAKQSDLEESPMAWWGDAEALGSSKDDLSVWELAGLEAAKTTVTDEVLEAEEELVSLAVEHSLELLEEHFGTKYEREPLVHTWQQRYVGKTMAWIMSAARELVEHRLYYLGGSYAVSAQCSALRRLFDNRHFRYQAA
eukprot:gene1609-2247_t